MPSIVDKYIKTETIHLEKNYARVKRVVYFCGAFELALGSDIDL